MSYSLTITAKRSFHGREAEDICRRIGIEPVKGGWISFEIGCCTNLEGDATIDRIIPYGKSNMELVLRKDEFELLRPGDYQTTGFKHGSCKVGGVWDAARMVALFDRVMEYRANGYVHQELLTRANLEGKDMSRIEIRSMEDTAIMFQGPNGPAQLRMSLSDAREFANRILRSLGD